MSLSIRRIGILGSTLVCSVLMVVSASASAAPRSQDVDWSAVEQALGRSGQMMPGDVFRIGMPRTDLKVTVEDVPVQAGFALGSYAAFEAVRRRYDGHGRPGPLGPGSERRDVGLCSTADSRSRRCTTT